MGKTSIYVIAMLCMGHGYEPTYAKTCDAYVSLNWLTP